MFSPYVPGYTLNNPITLRPEPLLTYGVQPMLSSAWVFPDHPALHKVYDGVQQDHEGLYYRAGYLKGGVPVKVMAAPGSTPYTGSFK